MNELLEINYDSEKLTVLGRELHKALEVNSNYTTWFKRMCEYGFVENTDFKAIFQKWKTAQGNETTQIDHEITISMAKEICMLQRSEKGKIFRQYFINIEEMWNTPEMVMKRALQIANANVERLMLENAVQKQQITELQPKANYYDIVLNCKDLLPISTIAKDYGWSAAKMNIYLNEKGVQYKQGNIWLLYRKYASKGYTSTKTHIYDGLDGTIHSKVHTYWTQSGRLFIYGLMKSDGILPLIERED